MERIASHVEDEETPDCSSPIERVRVDQKVDASRSKHSETEQRRRSKINERFQILRDLIPENDQKRDKASLLLEVIQYIQFLQEKLQMCEGAYQGWSSVPTKLAPWKTNSGQFESFLDQTQLERNISRHEDNGVLNPLSNVRNSAESDLIGPGVYKSTDNIPIATFECMSGQPHQECFPDAVQLTQLSQSQVWPGRSCMDDYSIPMYNTNGNELKSESGEPSDSSTYSQLILNSLKNALQSSGVDLSQASISVQLDVGKQINDRSTMAKFNTKGREKARRRNKEKWEIEIRESRIVEATRGELDNQNQPCLASVAPGNIVENYEHPHKRFRPDEC